MTSASRAQDAYVLANEPLVPVQTVAIPHMGAATIAAGGKDSSKYTAV